MTLGNEQRRIVAYLDGLPPSLRYGDLRQAKVNVLRDCSRKVKKNWMPCCRPLHRWYPCCDQREWAFKVDI